MRTILVPHSPAPSRYAGRSTDRRGGRQSRREIRPSRWAQAQRGSRAPVRRNGNGALIRARRRRSPRSRLGHESQYDVLVVIAKAAAEDIDAARMARIRLDLDPHSNRMVSGEVEILRSQGRDSHAVDK